MYSQELNVGREVNDQSSITRQDSCIDDPSKTMQNTYYDIEPQLVSEKNRDNVNKVALFNIVENPYYG